MELSLDPVTKKPAWQPTKHANLIAAKVMAAIAGTGKKRIAIAMPPQHGKSSFVSLYLCIWYLNMWPWRDIILTSYGTEYARTWSRKIRDIIAAHPELNVELAKISATVGNWRTTRGGGLVASGAGGSITGLGGDLIIVDDPYKNQTEALSAYNRDKVRDWWKSTVITRQRSADTVMILVQTRWHEDDLIGTLTRAEPDMWENIVVPAIAGPDDPVGRREGEPLWPEKYGLDFYAEQRAAQGEYWFASMYQGTPIPMSGSLFKAEWIQRYRDGPLPGSYELLDKHGERLDVVHRDQMIVFSTMDLAMSTKDSADWTVITTVGLDQSGRKLVLDLRRIRLEGPDQPALVRSVYADWRPAFIAIENAGYMAMLIQTMVREGLPIRSLKADADKVTRALTAAAQYEQGTWFHPQAASWVAALDGELMHFPKGAHDDQVDTIAYAARIAADLGPLGEDSTPSTPD